MSQKLFWLFDFCKGSTNLLCHPRLGDDPAQDAFQQLEKTLFEFVGNQLMHSCQRAALDVIHLLLLHGSKVELLWRRIDLAFVQLHGFWKSRARHLGMKVKNMQNLTTCCFSMGPRWNCFDWESVLHCTIAGFGIRESFQLSKFTHKRAHLWQTATRNCTKMCF